jgi:CMP-2-keto-3-deoxyoctulosonic acid synthetase
MKILVLIPARLESTRLPKKTINRDINGKSYD